MPPAPERIQVLPAFEEDGESWPPRIIWPSWAKLARQAGRIRAKGRAERRKVSPGVAVLLEAVAAFNTLDAQPPWVQASRIADTMRDLARQTRYSDR